MTRILKFKTERAVWVWLAKKWDRPLLGDDGTPYITVVGRRVSGLCAALVKVRISSEVIRDRLWVRMNRHRPPSALPGEYWWPLTKRGARSRAAFCRRMVREIDRERAKGVRRV